MRSKPFGMGVMVLGVAALLWTAVPSSAGRGGHGGGGGGGHSSGGHAAPARTGSVHYASHPAPARVAPARVVAPARTGTVHSEHHAGSPGAASGYHSGNGNRTRYTNEYFNRFRPGYLPFILSDGYQYYGYYDLPDGWVQVVEDGITYDYYDGIYYQPYMIGGRTVYIVVPS